MGRQLSRRSLDESQSGDASDDAAFLVAHGHAERFSLTQAELDAPQERVLQARNPHAPQAVVVYNINKRCFTEVPTIDHVQEHFRQETKLYERSSDEAKRQEQAQEMTKEGERADQHLRNEFNFSERATQTINNTSRERETNTEPPPRSDFKALATQWEIFDSFQAELERLRADKERSRARNASGEDEVSRRKVADHSHDSYASSAALLQSLRTTERMVALNDNAAIVMDYAYSEYALDNAPDQRTKGILMPLWTFGLKKLKKRCVTALAWNPEYPDLFAVGLGSYDFSAQRTGAVCCFSLKSPAYPDVIYTTESGVMCLDWHAQPHSSLLAVGFYDGSVAVYDAKLTIREPIFKSSVRTGKHADPVWQVKWQADDLAKKHNFFSVSSDGLVKAWTMVKSELQHADVIQLTLVLDKAPTEQPALPESELFGLAGGMCFDFNRFQVHEHLYVVGTEEGRIHKCSKAYSAQYLETYAGHTMAVYNVEWNRYHPRVFISCSADWTVKIWDHALREPLMSFDLNNSVADVAWAPYSSTVFAACTADGKVFVFDLAINKHEPMCEQKLDKGARLTHVAFNLDRNNFTLIVGDSKGCVRSYRLSPNLRRIVQEETPQQAAALADVTDMDGDNKPKAPPKSREQLELEKLESVLFSAPKHA